MKHATSRLLFAYWDGLRGERSAPERSAIRPGQIRQILADTFILGARPDGSASFRLAGTRCSALFGQELKDVPFGALWRPDHAREAATILEAVLSETSGIVAGLVGTSSAGARIALELVLLPLKHRGAPNTRALGALSPVTVPSWLGLLPVTEVEAQSIRIIRTDERRAAAEAAPASLAVPASPGRRSRFVILDGGLSR